MWRLVTWTLLFGVGYVEVAVIYFSFVCQLGYVDVGHMRFIVRNVGSLVM